MRLTRASWADLSRLGGRGFEDWERRGTICCLSREHLTKLTGKYGTDSNTAVTAYDRYGDRWSKREVSQDFCYKCRSTNNIQRRHTEDPEAKVNAIQNCCGTTLPLRVENTVFLEDLGNDRDRRVHWVGDNKNECLRGTRGDAGSKVAYDSSVDLGDH